MNFGLSPTSRCPQCGDLYDLPGDCPHADDIASWLNAPEVHFPAPRLVDRPYPVSSGRARGGDPTTWSMTMRNLITGVVEHTARLVVGAAGWLIGRLGLDEQPCDEEPGDPFVLIDPETVPKVPPTVPVPLPPRDVQLVTTQAELDASKADLETLRRNQLVLPYDLRLKLERDFDATLEYDRTELNERLNAVRNEGA